MKPETLLPHADNIRTLLSKGKRKEAEREHRLHVQEQFKRAREQGAVINLSDLMAAKEELLVDADYNRARG
jgi:hypothetical protein